MNEASEGLGSGAHGPRHVVVMGVSGCGKSSVASGIAGALGLPLVEGDSFHPALNKAKMRGGVPLTDADRAGWLARLADELRARPEGAVLACSALRRAYRDQLRAAASGLRFVHLAISQAESLRRVAVRSGHFYPPSLVASQFQTLEDPAGEPGVVVVDGALPLATVVAEALDRLRAGAPPGSTVRNGLR